MDELTQLGRSLDTLYRAVESIRDDDERRAAALRLASIVDVLATSAVPVPNPPGGYAPPRCPHCGKTVNVTLT